MKEKKHAIKLFWPGMWCPVMTYTALPAISAYLKNNGVSAEIEDLNMGYISHALSNDYIDACKDKLKRNLNLLKKRSPRRRHITFTLSLAERIVSKIPSALKILQRNDHGRISEAQKIIHAASYVIYQAYQPWAINVMDGSMGMIFKSASQLENFLAESIDDNPFYNYVRDVVLNKIDSGKEYIFGISLSGLSQFLFTYTLAKELKKVHPKCQVVIGGAYVPTLLTALKDVADRRYLFNYVDAYIVGPGERAFLEYIKNYSDQTPFKIDGVIYKKGGGYVYFEKPGKPLTSQEFLVPDNSYLKKTPFPLGKPDFAVEVARGCYWGRCTFCNSRYGSNSVYQTVDLDTIIASIRALKREGEIKRVLFSSLATEAHLLEKISKRLLKSKIKIKWRSWCRLDKNLTDKRLKLFKKAGCVGLPDAPENFDDGILALMDKGFTGRLNKTMLLRLKRHKLLESPNFICGFPGETEKNIIDTVNFAKRHGMDFHFFPFYIPKTCIIAEKPKKFGVKLLKTSNIRNKYRFRFLKTNYIDKATRVFKKLENVHPRKVYPLNGAYTIVAIRANFRTRCGRRINFNRISKSLRPYVPEYLMLIKSENSYWIFNPVHGTSREINDIFYAFLTLCNGARKLGTICKMMECGSNLELIKPFVRLGHDEGVLLIK